MRTLLLAAACLSTSSAALADTTTDFYAGQHDDVGDVTLSDDGETLVVTIDTSASGWELDVTHLYVGTEDPRKHAPGQFPYSHEDLGGVSTDTYTIDLSEVGATCGDDLVVAVHAEVEQFLGYEDPDVDAFNAALPTSGTMLTARPPGHPSFWTFDFSSATDGSTEPFADWTDGAFDGWCVDTSRTMGTGATYDVELLSSLDATADWTGLIDNPDGLDNVNWILNQDFTTQTCAASGQPYTMGDVQRSIWEMVEDTQATGGLGSWSAACAGEIIDGALLEGDGYTPPCDGTVGVVLVPVDAAGDPRAQVVVAQVTYAEVGLECVEIVQGETAWADGDRQFDRGWGWMIDYATAECGDDWPGGVEL